MRIYRGFPDSNDTGNTDKQENEDILEVYTGSFQTAVILEAQINRILRIYKGLYRGFPDNNNTGSTNRKVRIYRGFIQEDFRQRSL